MFETRIRDATTKQQVLAELRRRVDASTGQRVQSLAELAEPPGQAPTGSGLLAVPAAVAALLPRGGLPAGGVVSIDTAPPAYDRPPARPAASGRAPAATFGDSAATTLLLTLLAGGQQRWTAVVGMPDLGVLAGAELGIDLDRLALIPDPGPDVLHVLSVLADGVEVIAVAPTVGWGPPARIKVLTARLRQRGAVLLVLGPWPGADLVIRARHVAFRGIGRGHGRLQGREIAVTVSGRRMTGSHEGRILLSGKRDGLTVISALADLLSPAAAVARQDVLPASVQASTVADLSAVG